jgi:DNA-binding CsgD family transcriptional regulator
MWTSNEQGISNRFEGRTVVARDSAFEASLLLRMMDEVDHGMLVIDGDGALRHANHLARFEMAQSRFIMSHGQLLLGSTTQFSQQIEQATKQALKGHRQLVSLQSDDRELSLAFVPLSHALESDAPTVLVMLSRQNVCENLAVRMYARANHLSPSEEAVLIALCKGYTIPEIAEEHRVAVSTVRTQIKALRTKTGCTSIRMIMLRVNSLPPVMSALRSITPMPHNAMEFV